MTQKTYKYRIYLTKKQQRLSQEWLVLCCQVYNAALDERKSAYRMAGISLGYAQQCAELPGCKEVCPDLAQVPAQVLQDVVKRVCQNGHASTAVRHPKNSDCETDANGQVVCVHHL